MKRVDSTPQGNQKLYTSRTELGRGYLDRRSYLEGRSWGAFLENASLISLPSS